MTDIGFGAARIDQETFRSQLNTTFRVEASDQPVTLRLAEVVTYRSGGGLEQFSLFFHGPLDCVLAQGTYELRHDSLGLLTLFIVPVLDPDPGRVVYEAAFSRPIRASR